MIFFVLKIYYRDFPCGPVVKNVHFHCSGTDSIPYEETKILHSVQHNNNNKLPIYI